MSARGATCRPRPRARPADGPGSCPQRRPQLSGDIRHLIPKLGLREYWYPAIDGPLGGLAQAREGLAAGRGDLPLPRRQRRRSRPSRTSARIAARGSARATATTAARWPARITAGSTTRAARTWPCCPRDPTPVCAASPAPRPRSTRRARSRASSSCGSARASRRPSRRTCPRSSSTTSALVLIGQVYWRCNWEVALENSMDSHVNYVHRNARGRHAQRLHRPRRAGRAPHLRGQRLRRRRGREQLHAQEPGLRPRTRTAGGGRRRTTAASGPG